MKGKVKMFDAKKGYGFIKAEDNSDVFFHYSSIVMDGFKTANPGDEVEFEVSKPTRVSALLMSRSLSTLKLLPMANSTNSL